VCEATEQSDPQALDVLAAAYAELGRFGDAAASARRALDRAGGQPQLVQAIQERLKLYEDRLPYRAPTHE
jgi:cytochrome c-type biogenesis protein CcmH/NrfG